jgi:hypothetical protein
VQRHTAGYLKACIEWEYERRGGSRKQTRTVESGEF